VKRAGFAGERGESLVETVVSLGIMAIVITAFLTLISTGAFSVARVRGRVTAENLARAQLEYIKNHDYVEGATSYPVVEHSGEDCSVTIDVSYWYSSTGAFTSNPLDDSGMQWVTVTVSCDGEALFTIGNYKAKQ